MPRKRRRIESLRTYEICFRAKNSLPLVAYRIIDMIIEHALARTQRDDKLYLCHDLWNGSHPHIIVLTKDADQCKKFYMEVQKKITDCLKRLLGLQSLHIWEGRPTVALIGDLDEAIKRVSYIYANPAQDNLEESIEKFPGYSSFNEFLQGKQQGLDFSTAKEVLRLRLPSFPILHSAKPDVLQESSAIRLLKKRNKEKQELVRYPNIWMKSFGVREKDASEINERIFTQLRKRERIAAMLRRLTGKPLMRAARLKRQPILKPHKPKKKNQKISFLGSCRKDFFEWLEDFENFCTLCAECYQEWLKGNLTIKWPPGAFKPPLPPNMNILPV